MKGVLARVDKEFAIVENRAKANVAVLSRIDSDVPIFLVSTFRAQLFSVLRVLLNLVA
jgi:hypothetical protein